MTVNSKERDGRPDQQTGQTFQRSRQDDLNQSYRDVEKQQGEQGDRNRTQGREQRGRQGDGGQNRRGGQSGLDDVP